MIKRSKIVHLLLSLVLIFTSMNFKSDEVKASEWTEIIMESDDYLGEPVHTTIKTPRIDAWQYGDHWKIGDKTIKNSDAGKDTENLSKSYNTYLEFETELPKEVLEAVENGQELVVKGSIGTNKIKDLNSIYEINNSSYSNPSFKVEDDKLIFKAYPVFNTDKNMKYKDLLPFIIEEIPIVSYDFGGNLYSMYNKYTKARLGFAYADNYSGSSRGDGTVHPDDVEKSKGEEGEIKEGLKINVIDDEWNEKEYISERIRIGENTNLSQSAAMGMYFLYPTKLEIYLLDQIIEINHVDIDTNEMLEEKVIEEMEAKTYTKNNYENYMYVGYKFAVAGIPQGMNVDESKVITEGLVARGDNTKLTFYYKSIGEEIDKEGDLIGEDLNPETKGEIIAEEKGAEKFDVSLGIPTSEEEYVEAETKDYLYKYSFSNMVGEMSFKVTVKKTYILKWKEREKVGEDEDGDSIYDWVTKSETKEVSKDYNVLRGFSYWVTNYIEIFPFEEMEIMNYSLPNESVNLTVSEVLENVIIPEISIEAPEEGHIKGLTYYNEEVSAGNQTIDGGYSKPSVPSEDLSSHAESGVGKLLVANETVMIDNKEVSNAKYIVEKTKEPNPKPIEENKVVDLELRNLYIDNKKENGVHESVGKVNYGGIEAVPETFYVNDVVIHTPTFVKGKVYNDKEYNQEIHYNGEIAVVLDRPNKIQVKTEGQHRDILGYGEQEYKKYTHGKRVKFPFDVYFDTTNGSDKSKYVKANTWIDLSLEKEIYDYYVPTWVKEGEYSIEFVSAAINAKTWQDPQGTLANMELEEYIASDSVDVKVVGRLFGFKVKDYITDFIPNVQNEVTEGIVGGKDSGTYYPVGPKDENGEYITSNETTINNDYAYLPLIPGSSWDKYHGELDKGYKFAFEVTTIGEYDGIGDGIYIDPLFYHIDLEGNKKLVDIYVKTDHDDRVNGEFLLTKLEDYNNRNLVALYDNYRADRWEREKFIQVEEDLKELGYTGQEVVIDRNSWKGTDIGNHEYIYINEHMRTFEGSTENLPEGVDEEKARKSVQTWYGEFGLPSNIYVVEEGFDIENAVYPDLSIGKEWHGFDYKEPYFIRDGYIMVNFTIDTVKDGNTDFEDRILSYGYHSENANMWEIEGGMRSKRPRMIIGSSDVLEEYKNEWTAIIGDIVAYNMKYSIHDDYSIVGSH